MIDWKRRVRIAVAIWTSMFVGTLAIAVARPIVRMATSAKPAPPPPPGSRGPRSIIPACRRCHKKAP